MLRSETQIMILTNGLRRSGEKVGWLVCCGGSNGKWIRREGLVAKTIGREVNNEGSFTMVATATIRATSEPPLLRY